MKTLTIYKDNQISEKFEKPIKEIIKEYQLTEESKLDMPFERKVLNFLMNLGTFDAITDEQWNELYKENKEQRLL